MKLNRRQFVIGSVALSGLLKYPLYSAQADVPLTETTCILRLRDADGECIGQAQLPLKEAVQSYGTLTYNYPDVSFCLSAGISTVTTITLQLPGMPELTTWQQEAVTLFSGDILTVTDVRFSIA